MAAVRHRRTAALFWAIEPRPNKSYAQIVASRRKQTMGAKKIARRSSRPRLTISISSRLKRRIETAAAAQEMAVSSIVVEVLEKAFPSLAVELPGRKVTDEFMRRAEAFRKEQSAPFAVESAELIREARRERDARL